MAAKTAPVSKPTSTKKEFLLFISIPFALILLVLLVTVVPSLFARPAYDFIYSYCPSYSCRNDFVVDSYGHLKEVSSQTISDYPATAQLYYHNTANNSSKKIELAEAMSYTLDASNVSKDGYSLSAGSNSDGGFLFWGYNSDQDAHYLKKGSFVKSKALNLGINNYDSRNLALIGWVQK